MNAIQLTILCNKDEREAEDISTAKLLKDLGISKSSNDGVIQEWRSGFIVIDNIEAFYPHGTRPEHTVLQMISGAAITIKESIVDFINLLKSKPSPPPQKFTQDGQRIYEYQIPASALLHRDN